MHKESIIELQKIDCNCNDCVFLHRNNERFNQSLEDHHRWQLNYFNTIRDNLYKKADDWGKRGFTEKEEQVRKEADKMKFQFDRKEAVVLYGKCVKFDKEVSFIPNICQLDTQGCFEHRRTLV